MIRVTRWELIKAIAEAYKLYYLDDEKVDIPISIIYNKYGLSTTLSPKQRLADYEYLVLTISPGCFGDNVETIDDVYTWFIDYALIDIDYWINELKDTIAADKRLQNEIAAARQA